ncbi:MAG: helix-hairpin-helix domain-containing protein [Myxococcota bacterium]
MTPVEIPRTPKETRRVRFTENTSYGGVDYGPSYQAKEAEVRIDWARYFVRKGRAEYVTAPTPPEVPAPAEEPEVSAIPDDFPGYEALRLAGIVTFEDLDLVEDLESLPGIGPATARRIKEEAEEGGG